MLIVGCDFHPSWQQIALLDKETGEVQEHKLVNGDGEAERFYRALPVPARIGLEACGNSQWFIHRLQEIGHEVWIGDAAQIRASYVRKQKTDKRDALLAFVLTIGDASRFPRGKQVASYLGLIPSEDSSGGRQRLGHISKQGNAFLRGLLVEAAQSAVRHEPAMRREYRRLAQRKCRAVAKVAMARKLAVRLYWMLRGGKDYAQLVQVRVQDSSSHSVVVV